MSLFAIRPAVADDHALIIDSFWRDFRKSVYARWKSGDGREGMTVQAMRQLIIDLLARPDWKTVIAEMPEVPGEICGWMTYRSSCEVAWISVKMIYRENGCARAMLAHADVKPGVVACAFLDPWFADVARKRGYKLLFRPFVTSEAA